MSNQKVLIGLFAGVAIGAALGILFAPDKGSETRKKIKDKGNDYKQNLTDKYGQIVDAAHEKIESVKSRFNDLTGKAEKAANGTVEQTNATV